jgi:pimeloyl-ACP methyl ester carboxylesterase
MQLNYLAAGNYAIAYQEINSNNSLTIFFIHGNSGSGNSWRKQLESPLLSCYRMVAFDLPAHGNSSASAEPESTYNLPALAGVISEAIRQLSKGPYLICGVSLGTNILAEMTALGINPVGIMYAGSCLMGDGIGLDKVAIPGVNISVLFKDEPDDDEIILYGNTTSNSADHTDRYAFFSDFKAVKAPFRSIFINSILGGNLSDQIKLVKAVKYPQAWVFGADEKVVDPNYLDEVEIPKWKEQVFKLAGASHLVNIDAPDAFNQLLVEFATECFEAK